MVSKLVLIATILFCTYLFVAALVYFGQARMVYFPTRSITATPDQIGLRYEDVWLQTEDDVRIHGWYVPKEGAHWTVLFLHGNGGNMSHRLETLDLLHQIGVNTLIIDYRGYGMSQGSPSEAGTYLDAMAAWTYLSQHRAGADSTVVFGRSLGGAIAAWLAAKVDPKGLILESTFTSVVDMAQIHYPFLPARLLSRFVYDSTVLAPRIGCAALVLHSLDDEVVPFELGLKVFDALPGKKSFMELRGGHNHGIQATGPAYARGLQDFFDSLDAV